MAKTSPLQFVQQVRQEMTKVTWPTRKETTNNSIVVVVTCLIFGLWISFADVLFQKIQDFLYGMAG